MGREATCHLQWGTASDSCKVLLESTELIVRGTLRRRIPIASITDVGTEGGQLIFRVGQDKVSLQLGSEVAVRWAKAIGATPPSLATKLGVSDKTHLRVPRIH